MSGCRPNPLFLCFFLGLLGSLWLGGCVASKELEPAVIAQWNAASSDGPAALVGRWSGRAPDGSIVGFVFAADGSCEWLADSRMLSGRYEAQRHEEGLRVRIHTLPGERFADVEFRGWGKVVGDVLVFEGTPVRGGLSERGIPIRWPTEFSHEALVLRRTRSAN
jgi:hypothetical protein